MSLRDDCGASFAKRPLIPVSVTREDRVYIQVGIFREFLSYAVVEYFLGSVCDLPIFL